MITALFAAALAAASPAKVEAVKAEAEALIQSIAIPGVNVSLSVGECGMVNAFYYPAYDMIVLCTETAALPWWKFALAHEYAHAVIDQKELPVVGSEEVWADELGALLLLVTDQADPVLEAALYFKAQTDGKDNPMSSHPSDERRAWTLMCLADGSEDDGMYSCQLEFARAARSWIKLLGV